MTISYHTDLSKKVYWFYPKYDTLFKPTQQAFWSVQSNEIHVYIDASNFIESLIKPNVDFDDDVGIVAGLINLAIHFRKFYLKHFKAYSKIFIVYADEISNLTQSGCRLDINNPFMKLLSTIDSHKNVVLNANIDLASEICKYLPDIYFIKTNVEPAVKIRSLIMKYSKRFPVAIFSKDPFLCQIPAITPNAVLFRLIKNGNINEYIDLVNFNNSITYYLNLNKRSIDNDEIKLLSPYIYSTILTLTGCKERNIKLFMNTKKAISILLEGIKLNRILNTYPDIVALYLILRLDQYNINYFNLIDRFQALDIIYQQSQYDLTTDAQSMDWNINIKNNEALKEINDKYFIKNPLNINDL